MRTLSTSPPAISSPNVHPIHYELHRMSADAGVRACERLRVGERVPHGEKTITRRKIDQEREDIDEVRAERGGERAGDEKMTKWREGECKCRRRRLARLSLLVLACCFVHPAVAGAS